MAKTVLAVDDDAGVRDMLVDVLGEIGGYDVVLASSGEEALGLIFSGQAFDLLLTDRRMKGMWGDDLIACLRGRDYAQPMLMLTGDVNVPEIPGATRVLPKPFGVDALLEAVRDALAPSAARPVVKA